MDRAPMVRASARPVVTNGEAGPSGVSPRTQRDVANYISEMTIGLVNLAKEAQLSEVARSLEQVFYTSAATERDLNATARKG